MAALGQIILRMKVSGCQLGASLLKRALLVVGKKSKSGGETRQKSRPIFRPQHRVILIHRRLTTGHLRSHTKTCELCREYGLTVGAINKCSDLWGGSRTGPMNKATNVRLLTCEMRWVPACRAALMQAPFLGHLPILIMT